MNWYVTNKYNQIWHPYIQVDMAGAPRILFHHEIADTDMGDLFIEELIDFSGPLVIHARGDVNVEWA